MIYNGDGFCLRVNDIGDGQVTGLRNWIEKNDFHVKDSNSGLQKGPTPTLQHLLYQVLSTEMDSTQKDHFYILTSIEDIGRDGLTA